MNEVERREGKGQAEDEGPYPAGMDLAQGEDAKVPSSAGEGPGVSLAGPGWTLKVVNIYSIL